MTVLQQILLSIAEQNKNEFCYKSFDEKKNKKSNFKFKFNFKKSTRNIYLCFKKQKLLSFNVQQSHKPIYALFRKC